MSSPVPNAAPPRFSEDALEQQLGRIFLHPDFSNSEILRRFLTFVVHETCSGNAIHLKEYTIAVNALAKPPSFNPQKNCIVRIHAGRLRKALSHYYNEMTLRDEIIIRMPKGKYVPVFLDRQQWLYEKNNASPLHEPVNGTSGRLPATFAILPFHCSSANDLVQSFNDNLCLQICSFLSQADHISVIGYQAVRSLAGKTIDLNVLSSELRFDHIVCGGSQHLKGKLRVTVEIIDCRTYQQIWSKIFECRITNSNVFEVQDDICREIFGQAIDL
jgi:TolB-like protein